MDRFLHCFIAGLLLVVLGYEPASGQIKTLADETTRWTGSNNGILNNLEIAPQGRRRFSVNMKGGGNGCGMSFSGTAVERGSALEIRQGSEADRGAMCHIDIVRNGHTPVVREIYCGGFHGARCDFSGGLRLVADAAGVTPTASGTAPVVRQCPATLNGHRIARNGGGSLYYGSPTDNAMLAPSGSAGGENCWQISEPTKVVLVCRYEASPAQLTYALPPSVSVCRQRPGVSFICN